MAEEATQAEAQAEAPSAKKGGKGKLIIAAVVLLLAGGGGAAWWFGLLSHGAPAEAKEGEAGEVKEKRPEVGALLALDPFIANLADEDGKRYLKATVQIEFLDGKVPSEVNARLPQIRDLLLTLFTSKLFSEIRTPQGKAVLRDEIINRLNRVLRRDLVKAVYFTEFIVQ
jgi:flagellar FliL protein